MTDQQDSRSGPPGLFDRSGGPRAGLTGAEIAAMAASVLWLAISGWFVLASGGSAAPAGLIAVMVVVLPLGLIWVAAVSVGAARRMQAEAARLHVAVEALRKAYLAQAQSGRADGGDAAILRKLTEISAAQKNFETVLAMTGGVRSEGAGLRAEASDTQQADDQPALSLGTPAEALAPPLSNADYIRALNFPETAEDQDGFAALRRALRDRPTAQLIRASQDVLTLMSQDGIYMDDLTPDMARPETWRAFAEGARGRAVAALGGVHDRSSLALTAGRMRQDPIFRDAAHHFLRRFDQSFAAFASRADDAEISAFADTRTARAFMILGRVAGTFD